MTKRNKHKAVLQGTSAGNAVIVVVTKNARIQPVYQQDHEDADQCPMRIRDKDPLLLYTAAPA